MLLKCPDVASSMLAELTRFEQVPGQELRPWVRARTLALGVTATQGPGTRALAESTGPTLVRDAIGSLASASAALPALERLE
jgi:hypothetical protein